MNFVESIRMALASLMINKMRSFLTMLGIIIGISAVITITTIGNSISQTLNNTFNALGNNSIQLAITTKEYDGKYVMTDSDQMTVGMVNELLNQYPDELYADFFESFGQATILNENNEPFHADVSGITDADSKQSASQKFLSKGRWINKSDLTGCKHACMVTDIFVQQYFKDPDDALGATIPFQMETGEIYRFTIVGVMEITDFEKKQMRINQYDSILDVSTWVYIPYDTLLSLKGENPQTKTLRDATIFWTSKCDKDTAQAYCAEFFNKKYESNPMWQVAIDSENEDDLKQMNVVLTVVTVAISLISAISLIVGGVGVMNIMLVSILERTREIGVRKALGALNNDIRSQFVIEAIIICLIGGIIGVVLGIVNGVLIKNIAVVLIDHFAGEFAEFIILTVQPSILAIIISLGFSMLTGLIFGYYPAKRAANMNPIDALRYE